MDSGIRPGTGGLAQRGKIKMPFQELIILEAVRECPFPQSLCHARKNYPLNIKYIPAIIFSGIPRFWIKLLFSDSPLVIYFSLSDPTLNRLKNCYSIQPKRFKFPVCNFQQSRERLESWSKTEKYLQELCKQQGSERNLLSLGCSTSTFMATVRLASSVPAASAAATAASATISAASAAATASATISTAATCTFSSRAGLIYVKVSSF